MKRKFLAALLALVTVISALSLSSCGEKSEYPVQIGKTVINSEPENIVILNKNLADIISCIGYDIKLAGRSDEVNQKGMEVVPSVGAASNPSTDKIIKLKADMVFADESLNSKAKSDLEAKGVTVITPESAASVKELKALYRQLGSILGGSITGKEKGAEAFDSLYESLKDVRDAVDDKGIVRTICYLYYDGKMRTMNSGTWGCEMLGFTGASNVFKNEKSDVVNLKTLKLSNPDFIFCGDMRVVNYLRKKPAFKNLSAIKKNIHIIRLDEINAQGDSALDTLRKMLKHMYPEDFS